MTSAILYLRLNCHQLTSKLKTLAGLQFSTQWLTIHLQKRVRKEDSDATRFLRFDMLPVIGFSDLNIV